MSKQLYLVRYNNCHGQGYWWDGEWEDGTSIEGKTTSPAYWLKQHNRTRVGEQCGEQAYQLYLKCECEEEAIPYAMKKWGMSEDDAWMLWNDIESVLEGEDEFDFIRI